MFSKRLQGYYSIPLVADKVSGIAPAIAVGEPYTFIVYGRDVIGGTHIYGRLWPPEVVFLPMVLQD